MAVSQLLTALTLIRFDIYSFGFETVEDEAGMMQSAKLISQLISAEVESGTAPNRIVLGGFSQGGTMSLLTGLTGERKLAGIAVLSGWLPMHAKFKTVGVETSSCYPPSAHTFAAGVSARFFYPRVLGSWLDRPSGQIPVL